MLLNHLKKLQARKFLTLSDLVVTAILLPAIQTQARHSRNLAGRLKEDLTKCARTAGDGRAKTLTATLINKYQ